MIADFAAVYFELSYIKSGKASSLFNQPETNAVVEITNSLNQKLLVQFHLGLFYTFSPIYSLQPQSKNMNIGLTGASVMDWFPLPAVTRVGMATAGTDSSGPLTLIRHKLQKMDGLLIRHM